MDTLFVMDNGVVDTTLHTTLSKACMFKVLDVFLWHFRNGICVKLDLVKLRLTRRRKEKLAVAAYTIHASRPI